MRIGVTLTSRAVTLNGQDACPMCWEPLACGPAIMLTCGHACHLACAKEHLKQVLANYFQRYTSIGQINVHLLSLGLMNHWSTMQTCQVLAKIVLLHL